MAKYGSKNYCAQCEKTIPWSKRCSYCGRGLCYDPCQCSCPQSQKYFVTGGKPLENSDAKKPA